MKSCGRMATACAWWQKTRKRKRLYYSTHQMYYTYRRLTRLAALTMSTSR
jgi:hypothetical protein